MSFKVKENEHELISNNNDLHFFEVIPMIVQPYSCFFNLNTKPDIYSGNENIPFEKRHPTFKTLMKLEFQDVLREFERK